MLSCRVLLTTNFNRCIDIKDWSLSCILNRKELLDLRLLIFLYIAVKEECCVVLLVVDMGLTASMRWPLISNQFLKVSDQVVQLSHLDVVLDHITRIQEANRLDVLLYRFIVLLLLE